MALTNREYITTSLARFSISPDDIELILIENPEIDGNAEVDVRGAKLAVYNSLSTILPLANVSEGGYSLSWNLDALKMWYNALCRDLQKPNVLFGKPKIRNKSNLW